MSDYTYMILDGETGNALASFDDADEARSCLFAMGDLHPDRAEDLALISFDHDGLAVGTELLADLRQTA
jgi:hypothetical protein